MNVPGTERKLRHILHGCYRGYHPPTASNYHPRLQPGRSKAQSSQATCPRSHRKHTCRVEMDLRLCDANLCALTPRLSFSFANNIAPIPAKNLGLATQAQRLNYADSLREGRLLLCSRAALWGCICYLQSVHLVETQGFTVCAFLMHVCSSTGTGNLHDC